MPPALFDVSLYAKWTQLKKGHADLSFIVWCGIYKIKLLSALEWPTMLSAMPVIVRRRYATYCATVGLQCSGRTTCVHYRTP